MDKSLFQIINAYNKSRRNFSLDYRPNDLTGCTTTISTEEYKRLVINTERAREILNDYELELARIHTAAATEFAKYVNTQLYNIASIEKIEDIDTMKQEEVLNSYLYSEIDEISKLQRISEKRFFGVLQIEEMYEIILLIIRNKFMEIKNTSEEQKDGANEE